MENIRMASDTGAFRTLWDTAGTNPRMVGMGAKVGQINVLIFPHMLKLSFCASHTARRVKERSPPLWRCTQQNTKIK